MNSQMYKIMGRVLDVCDRPRREGFVRAPVLPPAPLRAGSQGGVPPTPPRPALPAGLTTPNSSLAQTDWLGGGRVLCSIECGEIYKKFKAFCLYSVMFVSQSFCNGVLLPL